MSSNLKIASIVVATLAITFSSLTLVKLCATFYENQQDRQMIDQGGVMPPTTPKGPRAEPWAAHATPTTKAPAASSSSSGKDGKYEDFLKKWNERKTTKTENVIGIIVTLISIFTSFMVFGAVSDDYEYNAMKRHMILPFVVFHAVTTFFNAVAICYIAVKYSEYMSVLTYPILIYTSMVFVTMVGISFVGSYFRCLSRMGGFSYAQMEDVVQEQKQPIHDVEVKKPMV